MPIQTVSFDSVICETDFLRLDASTPGGFYKWSDGSDEAEITVSEAGFYSVEVTNRCDTISFDYKITTENCFCKTAIPIRTESFDSLLCENSSMVLNAETPGGIYQWSTGERTSSIQVKRPGIYTVEVDNLCEVKSFDYVIDEIYCGCEVTLPNVFTPNGDGQNDYFEIRGNAVLSDFRMTIYDRTGKALYSTSDIGSFWDGKSQGEDLPEGNYYYSIELQCSRFTGSENKSYRGWVSVFR
ncbi:MAG: gliding motility-associated C-terminal domain-containing protein [Cyclobacteriaceae bacterium]